MIYTTILVQLDIDAPATPRLIFAQQIAKKFEADFIALVAAEPSALVSPSESSPLVAEVLRQRTHEFEERIKKLKEEFLAVVGNELLTEQVRGPASDPRAELTLL